MSEDYEQKLDEVLKRLDENKKQNTELFYRVEELCARSDKNTDSMITLINECRVHSDTMLTEFAANRAEMMKVFAMMEASFKSQQDMFVSLQKTNDSVVTTLNSVLDQQGNSIAAINKIVDAWEKCCHPQNGSTGNGETGQGCPPQSGENVTGYRKLSEEEIAAMNKLKGLSKQFLQALTDIQADILPKDKTLSETSGAYRSAALAKTKMQEACMWACRSVARPANDC